MKKCLSLFLSLVMAFTALFALDSTAYAAGLSSNAKKINFGTYYSASASKSDPTIVINGNKECYDAFMFTVPASGKVTLRFESENELYTEYSHHTIWKSSNMDNYYWYGNYSEHTCGYSAEGYYYISYTVSLPKGTYYLVCSYCQSMSRYNGDSYDVVVKYTPSFSKTSLSKVTAKKKAFNAKWKKCSNVSGYQLQYSTKKNMKSAKTFTFKGNKTTSKTVSKLKSKKKYYVRVRTYKTVKVNGKNKTYYSKWSSVKTVKTK